MTAKQILTKAGLQDSHWGQRIIQAEDGGEFTARDLVDAVAWQTCACGRQDPRIPRDDIGAPLDGWLRRFGDGFYHLVRADNFVAAAKTLVSIEKRAAKVLAEVVK